MNSFRLLTCMLFLIPSLLFASGGVTSGISILVEDGESEAGYGLEITKLGDIGKHFSIGGRFGYDRWSWDFFDDFKVSMNILEFAPALRINAPINDNVTYFFEPSAGFNLLIASAKYGSERASESDGAFGLSFATGLDIKRIQVKPAFKMSINEGVAAKWISVAAGFAF